MDRNQILVTVDSLRADHCRFLGSERSLTPALDELAKDSVVFEHALAPGPRTPSSMPTVFTGEFFQQHDLGVYTDYDEKTDHWVERRKRIARHLDRFRTLPERFRSLGFETAAVTANPWTTSSTNFDRGFDLFHAIQEDDDIRPKSLPIASRVSSIVDSEFTEWLLTWPDFYHRISETLEELSEPYFLWIFLLDPHQPYIAPRRFREENSALGMFYANIRYNKSYSYTDTLPSRLKTRLMRAYRDTIRAVDSFIGQLVSDTRADNPIITVHADHGESFQDHGTYGHRPQLYHENLHVPLLVYNTGEPGRVSQSAGLRHLSEYLLSLASADRRADPTMMTAPFVTSRTEECERISFRTNQWAYIRADDAYEDYLHGFESEELYQLNDDPDELRNLVHQQPEQTGLFRRLYDRYCLHHEECGTIHELATQFVERT